MNGNDRAIVGTTMLAHGMVHTYELSIPIFVSIWLTEFAVLDLGVAQLGVTEATLGLVVTAGYALFGVGSLPAGVLVDRAGSRRLIALCLFGMAGSFLVLSVAPGLTVVALALLAWGAAASVYHPAGLSLISKGVGDRGTGFAYHGIAGNVGTGLGPLFTAVLLLFLDWELVAALLAVPALVAGAYAVRAEFDETAATAADGSGADDDAEGRGQSESETEGGGSRAESGVSSVAEFATESHRLLSGAFVAVFVVVMCSGLYYRGVLTFMPNLLGGLPGFEPVPLASLFPPGAADFLGISGGSDRTLAPERYFYSGLLVVGVFGQYVGGKLTDRVPVEYGIAGAFAALGVVALLFLPAASAGLAPLLALGVVLGFVLFAIQPLYQASVAEYSPADIRGLSYGYTYLGVFGVGALGAWIAGTVLTYASPPALFAVLAGFAGVGALLGLALARRRGVGRRAT